MRSGGYTSAKRRTTSGSTGSSAEGGLKVSIWVFDMPTSPSLPQAMAKRSAFCTHPTFTGMDNAGFFLAVSTTCAYLASCAGRRGQKVLHSTQIAGVQVTQRACRAAQGMVGDA